MQISHVNVKVASFTETLAKKIGQSLQHSPGLVDLTLSVGKEWAKDEILTFENNQLQLASVSDESIIMLLQLNNELLQKVFLGLVY